MKRITTPAIRKIIGSEWPDYSKEAVSLSRKVALEASEGVGFCTFTSAPGPIAALRSFGAVPAWVLIHTGRLMALSTEKWYNKPIFVAYCPHALGVIELLEQPEDFSTLPAIERFLGIRL